MITLVPRNEMWIRSHLTEIKSIITSEKCGKCAKNEFSDTSISTFLVSHDFATFTLDKDKHHNDVICITFNDLLINSFLEHLRKVFKRV